MTDIKLLKKEFIGKGEVKGFHFKQVYMHDKFYIYKVTDRGEDYIKTYYELIKRYTSYSTFTKQVFENYPSSKSFGIKAWTHPTIDRIIESVKKHFDIDIQPIDIET